EELAPSRAITIAARGGPRRKIMQVAQLRESSLAQLAKLVRSKSKCRTADLRGTKPALLLVQPSLQKAEEALGHEDHHRRENQPDRDQVVLGEEARETLAKQQEERGPRDWADQRAHPAHDVPDHDLARDQEEDEVGRGELVLQRVEHAREAGEESRQ